MFISVTKSHNNLKTLINTRYVIKIYPSGDESVLVIESGNESYKLYIKEDFNHLVSSLVGR